jgi:predicted nucleic acid-binding protein
MKNNSLYLFDTNILISYANGDEQAKNILENTQNKSISVISITEFLSGIPKCEHSNACKFLKINFTILDVTFNCAKHAAKLRQTLRLKTPDALIYATALENNAILVTKDKKDFDINWQNVFILS